MRIQTTLVFFVLSASFSCTCIIGGQLDRIHASNDGGTDSGVDGGFDAGSDAGADAGTDAGSGDAGTLACAGSTRPRLRCTAISVSNSTDIRTPMLTVVNDEFLVGYGSGGGLHFDAVNPDGGNLVTVSQVALGYVPTTAALSGNGSFWAAVWGEPGPGVGCFAGGGPPSSLDASVALVDSPDEVAVVVSSDGGVRFAALRRFGNVTDSFITGAASGCPTGFTSVPSYQAFGISLTNVGAGPDTRYVVTNNVGTFNNSPFSGSVSEYRPDAGALIAPQLNFGDRRPYDIGSASSASGGVVIGAFEALFADGGDELEAVGLQTSPSGGTSAQPTTIALNPQYWSITPCDAGCTAIALILSASNRGPVSVSFVSDDLDVAPLGSGTYDVACDQSLSTGAVATAFAQNRLGVLFTNSAGATLYSCTPPF